MIFCENGNYRVGSHIIHDVHRYGWLSFQDVLKVSSNIGATKIGKRLGQKNFYTYINELRVKKFMDMVVDPKNKSLTFLAIAYECGFNSKSTFNSVFKKLTGFTPSEYIQSMER